MNDVPDIFIDINKYPLARRDENIKDKFNDIEILDPYRWLENPDSDETKNFVKALNDLSEPFINASSIKEELHKKLKNLWNYEKFGCYSKHGDYYYYYYNSGLENHSVYYQQKELDKDAKVFLNPNLLSCDGTTAINIQSWTKDGSIFAYGISENGSDWRTIKFKTVNGDNLPDIITNVKFSSITWLSTNEGIFYAKYPKQEGFVQKNCFHSLYFHKLGTDCKNDILVVQFCENENLMIHSEISDCGRYLIINASEGCSPTNQLFYCDLSIINNKIEKPLDLKPLCIKFDAQYNFVDIIDDYALILTNLNAPMFKLIKIKLSAKNDQTKWETFIEEDSKRKLDWAAPVANDKLLVSYIEDVKSTLYVHDLNSGKLLYQIPTEIGAFCNSYISKTKTEFFFSFDSPLVPTIVYRGDFSKALSSNTPVQLEEIRKTKIPGIDTNNFMIKQVFYPSKDNTKIPMYIVSRKDIVFDGKNPTILNGYGGFNVSVLPNFSFSFLAAVHLFGAVYATANLRGGSEYGEKWHESGMLENKQNVFDDFISAAEYLIQNKYTTPKKLAIHGASNGGLLVAACSQQRPDLFGAVLNRVGVLDMLRFHKFTIGSAWIPEFGNPEDPKHFEFIYKYSPLHNIKIDKNQQFPATFLMTADHDDRVVPSHTLKYIAELYYKIKKTNCQHNPVLARIDVKAGHGAGCPTSKVLNELVNMFCFLQRVLDMKLIN